MYLTESETEKIRKVIASLPYPPQKPELVFPVLRYIATVRDPMPTSDFVETIRLRAVLFGHSWCYEVQGDHVLYGGFKYIDKAGRLFRP